MKNTTRKTVSIPSAANGFGCREKETENLKTYVYEKKND